jgi:hypothetical protein
MAEKGTNDMIFQATASSQLAATCAKVAARIPTMGTKKVLGILWL